MGAWLEMMELMQITVATPRHAFLPVFKKKHNFFAT
jgi:hypothetical protein